MDSASQLQGCLPPSGRSRSCPGTPLKGAREFLRVGNVEGGIHRVRANPWQPVGRIVCQHENGSTTAGPTGKSFHSDHVLAHVMSPDVMCALLSEREALAVHVD